MPDRIKLTFTGRSLFVIFCRRDLLAKSSTFYYAFCSDCILGFAGQPVFRQSGRGMADAGIKHRVGEMMKEAF